MRLAVNLAWTLSVIAHACFQSGDAMVACLLWSSMAAVLFFMATKEPTASSCHSIVCPEGCREEKNVELASTAHDQRRSDVHKVIVHKIGLRSPNSPAGKVSVLRILY